MGATILHKGCGSFNEQKRLNMPVICTLNDLPELEGKTVCCHCEENEKCHGDILIKLVTKEKPTLIL
jgi:hypothetical protein